MSLLSKWPLRAFVAIFVKIATLKGGQLLSMRKIPDVRVPFLGQNLAPVPSVKDLGIIFDSNLTFNERVNTMTSSLISTLCQIRKVGHLFSKSVP